MALRKTIGQLASGDLVSFPGAFRTTDGQAPNNKQFSVFTRLSSYPGRDYTTFLWAWRIESLDVVAGPEGAPDGNSKYVSLPRYFNQEDQRDRYDFKGSYKLLNGSIQNLLLFKYLNSLEEDWISSTGYDYDKAGVIEKVPYAQKGAPSFLNGLTDTQTAIKALKPITEDVYCGKGDTIKTFITLVSQEELEFIKADKWFGRGGKLSFPSAYQRPFKVITSEISCPDKLYYVSSSLEEKGIYDGQSGEALYRLRLYNDTIVEYNESNGIWYVVEAFDHSENVGYYIQDGKQKVIKTMWVQKDGKLRRYLNKVHT